MVLLQGFFLKIFLFYSLRLVKTLSGFRDLEKTRKTIFCFLFHPLKYFVKKIRATHKKVSPYS
jgi:hypothetical protein